MDKLICLLQSFKVKVTPGQCCLMGETVKLNPPVPLTLAVIQSPGVDVFGAGYNYRTPAAPVVWQVSIKFITVIKPVNQDFGKLLFACGKLEMPSQGSLSVKLLPKFQVGGEGRKGWRKTSSMWLFCQAPLAGSLAEWTFEPSLFQYSDDSPPPAFLKFSCSRSIS